MTHAKFTAIFVAIVLTSSVTAQSFRKKTLTNANVVAMVKAGLSPDVITAKIQASKDAFNTSPDALVQLRQNDVPNSVILQMVNAPYTSRKSSTPSPGPNERFIGTQASNTALSGQVESASAIPVEWAPQFGYDGQLYPALILELEGRHSTTPMPPNYIGDPSGMFNVKVKCGNAPETVQLVVRIDGISKRSTLIADLTNPGQFYHLFPVVRYDFSKLETIYQSFPTTVTYSLSVNGIPEGEKTETIQVRSVNDVPFAVVLNTGKIINISFFFAGFVEEDDPYVQKLLQQALDVKAARAFLGYQQGPAGVEKQVFAIWNVLQRDHVHYSSTTTPSAAAPLGKVFAGQPSGRVYSQAVRFLDQSVRDQQANCIDGTVLFASILYKIGIDPLLVILPGHAFVGYWLDPQHQHPQFLETTLIGQGPMPLNMRFGLFYNKYQTASYKEFLNAVQYGNEEFNQKVLPNLGKNPQYMLIDIQKARQDGINPIPRP